MPNMDPTYYANPGTINRVYDNIQVTMTGAGLEVIKMMLWNTIEEFCLTSTYFRAQIPWVMGPGTRDVDFNPFSGEMQVCRILEQRGLIWWRVQPPSVLVDSAPEVAQQRSGFGYVALRPVSLDHGLPGALFDDFFEVMLDGVKGRLASMPAKPYTSPDIAKYSLTRFRVGMQKARREAIGAYSGQQAFRFPYFARGRLKN
jgi:hypothetical protein